jgi:hypothetical protein
LSRLKGTGPDAYWKRFGEVFHVLKKELVRQQLFGGNEFQRRRRVISVAAGLTDAVCESEGLDFMNPEPNPVETKVG